MFYNCIFSCVFKCVCEWCEPKFTLKQWRMIQTGLKTVGQIMYEMRNGVRELFFDNFIYIFDY